MAKCYLHCTCESVCVLCVLCAPTLNHRNMPTIWWNCVGFYFLFIFFLLAILLYGIAKCSLVVELDVFGRMAKPSKAPSRILLRHFSWTLIYNLAFAGWRCWLFRVLFLLLLYITQESCRTLNISCPNAAVFWPANQRTSASYSIQRYCSPRSWQRQLHTLNNFCCCCC